jgi:dipeptidyl aminopeptidase
MLTPEMNPHGYETSAVHNMTGFHHAKYLLIHGTADDNGI